jgi:hypothetical protein
MWTSALHDSGSGIFLHVLVHTLICGIHYLGIMCLVYEKVVGKRMGGS